MISLRARFHRFLLTLLTRRIDADNDVELLRDLWRRVASRLSTMKETRVDAVSFAGVDAAWMQPPGVAEDAPVLLYLHGGAYVAGSSYTHRRMVSYLAHYSGCRALVPNYRLAPEHPFPAGLEDCVAVYRALLDTLPAKNIVVAGDSAGGGMTMALLLSLREAGDPLPAAAYLLSPWLDLTGSGESASTRATVDPMFDIKDMPKASAHYAPQDRQRDPLVSPVFADPKGLPPMLIQVGDEEILLSDSTRLAERISAVGGDVNLQVWPGMWHVFQYYIRRIPEAERALRDAGRYLKDILPRSARESSGLT